MDTTATTKITQLEKLAVGQEIKIINLNMPGITDDSAIISKINENEKKIELECPCCQIKSWLKLSSKGWFMIFPEVFFKEHFDENEPIYNVIPN